MKRKVKTRKTGKKSRKDTTSILLEGSLSKFFFFDKEHESHQEKEPLCSLPELYFSQKGYFLLATLRFIAAYVVPGHIGKCFAQCSVAVRFDPDAMALICLPEGSEETIQLTPKASRKPSSWVSLQRYKLCRTIN